MKQIVRLKAPLCCQNKPGEPRPNTPIIREAKQLARNASYGNVLTKGGGRKQRMVNVTRWAQEAYSILTAIAPTVADSSPTDFAQGIKRRS